MKKVLLPCSAILSILVLVGLFSAQAFAGGAYLTFRAKMNIKILEGTFQPGSGDIVQVKGGINGWAGTDTCKDPDGDSVYEKTILTGLIIGDTIYYKFYKTLRG